MEEQNQNQEQQTEQRQEQVETVAKSEYDSLVAELEKVKAQLPKELSEEEKAIQAKQQELWEKEVSLSLKENGLEQFASIIKVTNEDELEEVITQLTQIVNDIKVSTGYVPADHARQSAYDQAKQKGDTKGMIKSLFGLN